MTLSPGFWENFEVSLIFFVLDILLLVLLLPLVFSHFEQRRWKPMRRLLCQTVCEACDMISRDAVESVRRRFKISGEEVIDWVEDGGERFVIIERMKYFKENMTLYAVCIEPKMVESLTDIMRLLNRIAFFVQVDDNSMASNVLVENRSIARRFDLSEFETKDEINFSDADHIVLQHMVQIRCDLARSCARLVEVVALPHADFPDFARLGEL